MIVAIDGGGGAGAWAGVKIVRGGVNPVEGILVSWDGVPRFVIPALKLSAGDGEEIMGEEYIPPEESAGLREGDGVEYGGGVVV